MFVWSQQSKSKGLKPQNLVQPNFSVSHFLSDTNNILYDLEGKQISTTKSFVAQHLYEVGFAIIGLVMLVLAILWYFLIWRRNNHVNSAEESMDVDEVGPTDLSEPKQQSVE